MNIPGGGGWVCGAVGWSVGKTGGPLIPLAVAGVRGWVSRTSSPKPGATSTWNTHHLT